VGASPSRSTPASLWPTFVEGAESPRSTISIRPPVAPSRNIFRSGKRDPQLGGAVQARAFQDPLVVISGVEDSRQSFPACGWKNLAVAELVAIELQIRRRGDRGSSKVLRSISGDKERLRLSRCMRSKA
jgi:hypothetical protein